MPYLGIDIGGTSIKAGLVDESGRILATDRADTPTDDLEDFVSCLVQLIRRLQNSSAIEAVGLGVPGLLSQRNHIVETSPNIPCLRKVPLEALLLKEFQLRFVSENDANAAAYAEFICGAGAGSRHMAHITLGTGVGSGFILNGALYTGASGYAAEFGHTTLHMSSTKERPCACGRYGCVEAYISGTAIVTTAREKMNTFPGSSLHQIEPALTSENVYEAAMQGDAAAKAVFDDTGRYLGIACANLINLLNFEMIVIGGGVMAAGDTLLHGARKTAREYAFEAAYADCQIVQSRLWPDAGIIGAAMLARDRLS